MHACMFNSMYSSFFENCFYKNNKFDSFVPCFLNANTNMTYTYAYISTYIKHYTERLLAWIVSVK